MINTQLFQRLPARQGVRTGVIGTGHFAKAVVAQAASMARISVLAVADLEVAAAQQAYRLAGIADDQMAICASRAAALAAIEQGKRVIVEDALLLMDLPLAVIVESTGVPEAGARHALAAIEHGKHIVMVNKETDVSVGPILKQRAERAGLVYTQADGDQHGALITLIEWARELGLEVLCAGKARDGEYVYAPAKRSVTDGSFTVTVGQNEERWLQPIPRMEATASFVAARREVLAALEQVGGFDLTEMAIVANASGLPVDVETLHCPALRTSEMPVALCPQAEGGILSRRGVIDAVTSLHYPEEAGLGGGVFVVVSCASDYARHILATKGCLTNAQGTSALIYRPYHLCGVETPMSVLCAGLLGIGTGAHDYHPYVDLYMRAAQDLPAGHLLGNDHSPELQALIRPASCIEDGAPLPLHMGSGRRLRVDVSAGTVITVDMIERPSSTLWTLRGEQDALMRRPAGPRT